MNHNFRRHSVSFQSNTALAASLWGKLSSVALKQLSELTRKYGFSVAAGDLLFFEGRWYVTHAGLLRIAQRRRCAGIRTSIQSHLSDADSNRWVFKATVYSRSAPKGFVGYGDADPSNVSPLVRGAELRVAETRAVNRALRKAYGIGLCSVEELGSFASSSKSFAAPLQVKSSHDLNGSGNGQSRLRDQLCLLIRQYNLDPTRVKAYAADFCGTQTLKEASRDLVESFITHLAEWAARDRSGLLSKLNSFAPSQEVSS